MLSCEFYEISENNFYYRTPQVAASLCFKVEEFENDSSSLLQNVCSEKTYQSNLLKMHQNFFWDLDIQTFLHPFLTVVLFRNTILKSLVEMSRLLRVLIKESYENLSLYTF